MKLATKLRKKVILETYRKDFPNIDFNDYNSGVTISNNGRVIMGIDEVIKFGKLPASHDYLPLGIGTFIHNSLIGIDDNNGWIRIEPDGSNLPKDDRILNSSFIVFDITDPEEEDMTSLMKASANGVIQLFKQGRITHYKPIKEEPKPIY